MSDKRHIDRNSEAQIKIYPFASGWDFPLPIWYLNKNWRWNLIFGAECAATAFGIDFSGAEWNTFIEKLARLDLIYYTHMHDYHKLSRKIFHILTSLSCYQYRNACTYFGVRFFGGNQCFLCLETAPESFFAFFSFSLTDFRKSENGKHLPHLFFSPYYKRFGRNCIFAT